MLGPAANGTTFRAQTCIQPDRIALLARDVGRVVRGGWRSGVLRFDGATEGRLDFSVRRPLTHTRLLAFRVDIARRGAGFTIVEVHVSDRRRATAAVGTPDTTAGDPAMAVFDRYTGELATALARFDPQSTAITVETAGS